MAQVIGIDVGTQSTKGVLLDERSGVVAVATAGHEVAYPAPAWAEQDPRGWSAAAAEVIGALLASAGAGEVTHIGIDAQVDGVVAVDAGLAPLHPAIIWMDRRAVEYTGLMAERIGAEQIFRITGLNCDSSHAAPKMGWLLDRVGERIAWLLPPASYLTSWLSGEVAQDHANASSSMLWDVAERAWSPALLDAAQIDPALLPPVAEATTVIGPVRRELATELRLAPTCLVLVGTGDDQAAAVGAGAVAAGVVADVTGTAEPIGTSSDTPILDLVDHLVETHAHAVPGMWFIENPGFVSGGSTRWCAELLGIDHSDLFSRAGEAVPGCGGLVFVPALSGSMTPRWNDLARGSFTGASLDHGPAEWCRAVLEGCAYALRDVLDRIELLGLATDDIRVTGGGARSRLWLQIKADVTGRVVRAVTGEGTAMGAACLAAVAAGWYPDLAAATRAVVVLGDPIEPGPTAHARYQETYQTYRRTFDALEPTW